MAQKIDCWITEDGTHHEDEYEAKLHELVCEIYKDPPTYSWHEGTTLTKRYHLKEALRYHTAEIFFFLKEEYGNV